MRSQAPQGPVVLAMHGSAHTPLQHSHRARQVRLDDSDLITPESLAANQVLLSLLRKTKDAGGRLHLIGLVSESGAHSSYADMLAVIDVSARAGVRVVIHAILDGAGASEQIAQLEDELEGGRGRIGTVSGRAFAVDCEGRWDRIEKVYRAVLADGAERSDSALKGIHAACAFGHPEAFVKPFIAFDYPGVSLVDTALHLHFAADGARELSHALAGASFDHFARKLTRAPFAGRYACMTPYDSALGLPTLYARAPDPAGLPFDALASAGIQQLHCTEGSATTLARATTEAIHSGRYRLVVADFASPDNPTPSGTAAELERALGEIVAATRNHNGAALLLGGRDAANTFPLVYVNDADSASELRSAGQFCDLGPTLLELLQVPQPADVEGTSLLDSTSRVEDRRLH